MIYQRRIIFVLHPAFETLDVAGPASVFHAANGRAGKAIYELQYATIDGLEVTSNAGLQVSSVAINGFHLGPKDTFIIPGADASVMSNTLRNMDLIHAIQKLAQTSGRVASVCSGSFFLAKAGLLDHKRATTHWEAAAKLKERYSKVSVEPDALYTVDDGIWTSAGVSTGIDMALAMVEADVGADIMRKAAQRLVVHSKRAGSQSQFSSLLTAQTSGDGEFSDLITWMDENMARQISVADLARRCGMSERNFHRKFTKAVGDTPAKFFDDLRMQRAKELLDAGQLIKVVTHAVGFRSESGFRNAFEAQFGISPSVYASMNSFV